MCPATGGILVDPSLALLCRGHIESYVTRVCAGRYGSAVRGVGNSARLGTVSCGPAVPRFRFREFPREKSSGSKVEIPPRSLGISALSDFENNYIMNARFIYLGLFSSDRGAIVLFLSKNIITYVLPRAQEKMKPSIVGRTRRCVCVYVCVRESAFQQSERAHPGAQGRGLTDVISLIASPMRDIACQPRLQVRAD